MSLDAIKQVTQKEQDSQDRKAGGRGRGQARHSRRPAGRKGPAAVKCAPRRERKQCGSSWVQVWRRPPGTISTRCWRPSVQTAECCGKAEGRLDEAALTDRQKGSE